MTYKIYKIIPCCEIVDENDVYYGSTSQQYLCNRFENHKNTFKQYLDGRRIHRVTSFSLFEKYGLHNCKIVLVEEFKFEEITEIELRHKEAEYIKNNPCVNINNPTPLTAEDYKQKSHEYYKNVICQNVEKKAKHIQAAKAFLKQKEEEGPILCECGDTYTYKHKSRHLATERHRLGTDEEYRKQKETEKVAAKAEQKIKRAAYKKQWYEEHKTTPL
jgi:hypothetical protein